MPGNPFDDSSDEGGNDGLNQVQSHVKTNPFDDSDPVEFLTEPIPPSLEQDNYQDDLMNDGADAPLEASWQYLGDLPYRRVPMYPYVRWNRNLNSTGGGNNERCGDNESSLNNGLAAFPPQFLQSQQQSPLLDAYDVRELLSTTTTTKVCGCAHGGPIAAITLPLIASAGALDTTELRIMTNAGRPLANIEFPPRRLPTGQRRAYSAADVLTIGFTDRTILIVVLRDSLCITYDLSGKMILPPFHILQGSSESDGNSSNGMELLQACVYEGGVAVLSTTMHSALVELLDQHDDPAYASGANLGARRIVPNSKRSGSVAIEASSSTKTLHAHYALVTPLFTASHASDHYCSFVSLAVLSRFHTASRHPEVFLSTSDNSVAIVNTVSMDITDVNCRSQIASPIVAMSFAPNGRFLACFTENHILTVISTSFETKVLDFNTSDVSSAPLLNMIWCGEDSVILHWKNLGVLMVGPYGDWLRFPYEDADHLYIIPETDSCRVVTDTCVEILQRVPPATALLLRIGSIEPSAMLLDAADAFESGSPASDEAARAITKTGMLLEAIETCTDAAMTEFDIPLQKRLLRAASYGLHFLYKDSNESKSIMGGPAKGVESDEGDKGGRAIMPSLAAIQFVEAAKKIRVLNSLRDPAVGFILTSSQFDTITTTGVVARLIAMKRPALATSISKYCMLPTSVQLLARASKAAALVSSNPNMSDTETANAAIHIIKNEQQQKKDTNIKSKLPSSAADMNRGGYASVALAANQAGRPGVANLLLMLESSVVDKVQTLISIGSYADAAAVATTARNGDFIFYCLMEYEKACMLSSFDQGQKNFMLSVISKFSREAFHTCRRYCMSLSDMGPVKDLLVNANRLVDAGSVVAKKALACKVEERERKARLLNEASHIFGQGKDAAFHKSCTDDYSELLRDQEVLRKKYGTLDVAPESSSVTSTIVSLIQYGAVHQQKSEQLLNDTDKLAKKFRIPDRRMWHVKVAALSDSGQWIILKSLAESRAKSPIGFKPFARAAIKGGQDASYIIWYIERIAQHEGKYDMYCEAQLWNKALDEAHKLRDMQRISHVRSVCNSASVQARCDKILSSGGV